MTSETKNKVVKVSWKILKETFPDIQSFDKLQMTETGIYSVTGRKGAQFIANQIIKYMKTNILTITDCTANNGSDTIMFGIMFKNVNAIELDKINYDVLKNNIDVFKLDNVIAYNNDTLEILGKLQQDVIYLDAPWGGRDYKDQKSMSLFIGDLEISYFYLKYKDNAKLFVFKVPRNYDFNNFISVVKTSALDVRPFYDLTKRNPIRFYLIIISTQQT